MNILNSPTTISQSNIFPKYPENFGMVAIEAAVHGTPTVAFATGGIVDAVAEGVSGYLVEKNNYSQLSKQVITLLANPLPKENMQDFARQFEWGYFGIEIKSVCSRI